MIQIYIFIYKYYKSHCPLKNKIIGIKRGEGAANVTIACLTIEEGMLITYSTQVVSTKS